MILVRASGAGIKREGLLYFEKYGTGGPEFGIKEEFVTERGRQLFHVRAWTGRLVVYSSPNWPTLIETILNQWLHTGKETTAPRDRTKTQYQWTTDWTKVKLRFGEKKRKKKGGSATRCTLIEGFFSTNVHRDGKINKHIDSVQA